MKADKIRRKGGRVPEITETTISARQCKCCEPQWGLTPLVRVNGTPKEYRWENAMFSANANEYISAKKKCELKDMQLKNISRVRFEYTQNEILDLIKRSRDW